MSERSTELFLNDILDCINKILDYTKSLTMEKFSKNELVQDAVIRNFEIIGEATKNIPKDLKTKYPEIPWKKMAGMRDKMTHEYFGVDIDIVWQTIKYIPELIPLLKNIKI